MPDLLGTDATRAGGASTLPKHVQATAVGYTLDGILRLRETTRGTGRLRVTMEYPSSFRLRPQGRVPILRASTDAELRPSVL